MSVFLKKNGIWEESNEVYFKQNGEWKQVCGIYNKVNGAWVHTFSCAEEYILNSSEDVNLGNWLALQNATPGIGAIITIPAGQTIGGTIPGGAAIQGGNLSAYPSVVLNVSGDVYGHGGTSSYLNGSPALYFSTPVSVVDTGGTIRGGGGAGGAGGQGGYGEGADTDDPSSIWTGRNLSSDGMHWKDSRIQYADGYSRAWWSVSGSSNSYINDNNIGRHNGYEWIMGIDNGWNAGANSERYEFWRRDNWERTGQRDGGTKYWITRSFLAVSEPDYTKFYDAQLHVVGYGEPGAGGNGRGYIAGGSLQSPVAGSAAAAPPRQWVGQSGQGGGGGEWGQDGSSGGSGGSGVRWSKGPQTNGTYLDSNWKMTRVSDSATAGFPGEAGGSGGNAIETPAPNLVSGTFGSRISGAIFDNS